VARGARLAIQHARADAVARHAFAVLGHVAEVRAAERLAEPARLEEVARRALDVATDPVAVRERVADVVARARIAQVAASREGPRRLRAVARERVAPVVEEDAYLEAGLGLTEEARPLPLDSRQHILRAAAQLRRVCRLAEPAGRDRARHRDASVARRHQDLDAPPRVAGDAARRARRATGAPRTRTQGDHRARTTRRACERRRRPRDRRSPRSTPSTPARCSRPPPRPSTARRLRWR